MHAKEKRPPLRRVSSCAKKWSTSAKVNTGRGPPNRRLRSDYRRRVAPGFHCLRRRKGRPHDVAGGRQRGILQRGGAGTGGLRPNVRERWKERSNASRIQRHHTGPSRVRPIQPRKNGPPRAGPGLRKKRPRHVNAIVSQWLLPNSARPPART
jgi:hypothetical protein